MRSLPGVFDDEAALETPAISYYMELTLLGGASFRFANYDVNWTGAGNAATHGWRYAQALAWAGSSTQSMALDVSRQAAINALGADFGDWSLANLLRGAQIKLWWRASLDADLVGALAAGRLVYIFGGRVLSCDVAPLAVTLKCSTAYAAESMTPIARIAPPVFNYVPGVGDALPYNGGTLQMGGGQ